MRKPGYCEENTDYSESKQDHVPMHGPEPFLGTPQLFYHDYVKSEVD